METGEYRGFAGQFPHWLRTQCAVWRWPLLLSLLLHVCLFWPQALRQSGAGTTAGAAVAGLQARLRPVPAAARQVADVVAPRPAPAPRLAKTRADTLATPRPATPAAISTTSPAAPLAPAETARVADTSSGLDAGALRVYRLALAHAIRADLLRPSLPDPAFQGALLLGIGIGAGGQLMEVAVLRSSGSPRTDAAVLAAVGAAAQAAPIPVAMRGRNFVIELPVEIGAAATTAAAGR